MTNKLKLTMACGLYDRMLDLYRGDVRPDGIELNFIPMDGSAGAREIFDRMAGNLEFDVAEMSSSEFFARKSAGYDSLVALPVFPSRVFRHGMVSINTKSGIKTPKDLDGKRVGVPIYTMSAAVWMKGHLKHDYGVDLSTIQWVEGAINHPGPHGHPSILPLLRPARIEINASGKSLSDLLEEGNIDAIVGTVLPDAIHHNQNIRRLFPNYREEEKNYCKRTRIFPIMHLLAMRRDIYEEHPFIASSLFDAMSESKERARKRMRDLGTLNYMLPWMTADLDEIDEVFGGDAWPYGIEPNRPTLEALMTYLADQAIIKEPMPIEDMFVRTYGRYDGKTGRSA
ncbi:MAG: ABC transporter substrate-binding protein [Hyphomicrobiales bacterium]|nr:ABC transporter substrate-binding protein [Hyphomicrobiales bacterium]